MTIQDEIERRIMVVSQKAYLALNGVVNTRCKSIGLLHMNYDDFLDPDNIFAAIPMAFNANNAKRQLIVIVMDKISSIMMDMDRKYWDTNIVSIVTHELCHGDQYINKDRYMTDPQYRYEIERDANMNAFRFIYNYKEWMQDRIGVSIYTDYIEEIWGKYLSPNFLARVKEKYIPLCHH